MSGTIRASDSPQNENDAPQFQRTLGTRAEYYARKVADAEARRGIEGEYDRARFWFAVRVAFGCVLTTGVGLFVMGWALHTTDMERAQFAWTVGPIIGYSLTLILLGWAAAKWERDDW